MDLVADALQRPPEERELFVQQACEGDEELLRAVNDALAWETRNASFLTAPWMEFTRLIRPFAPGEIVADRFEIVREIGEGGMGIVYEAIDGKRHLRIAIKAAKPGFQRLLSPELEGALKVRHSNVCLVNQIHTAQTQYGEIDFLTMEFLEGETLAERLDREGAMPEPAALSIARQLCLGLAEAHRSGVIHRDLKTSNIILAQNADGSTRAVITDFGLAGNDFDSNVVAGTPRYISPELWDGKPATQASDIYALGVILYELVKGQQAEWQVSENGFAEVPSPDSIASLVPGRWAATVKVCLDSSPEARPRDAMQVLAGLEKRRLRLLPLLAIPVLAAATLLSPGVRTWAHDLIWPPPGLRLVVLPPAGSDAAALTSNGALDDVFHRLSHAQSGSRSLAVISPEDARDLGVNTPEQAKTLHATHALETRTHKEGEDTVIEGAVIDLETQSHVRDFNYRYTPKTVGAVAGAVAGEVSASLGLRPLPSTETLSAAATGPYDRGLYLFQQDQNYEQSIGFFQEAARLDPRSPLPPTALVEAEIQRFEDTKDPSHLDLAQHYLQIAESLDPDSVAVHLAAGKLNESNGRLEKALEEYLRAKSVAPTNLEAALRAAGAYNKLDMSDKAIGEYHRAIELDPSFYKPYEYLGVFYYFRGQYSEAAEQFRKVIERAPGVYWAWANLSSCLDHLGRKAEAVEAMQHALQLHTSPDFLHNMGALLSSQGRDADAIPYFERAVALNPNEYVYLLNMGDSNRRLGHSKAAGDEYRRGLQLAEAELQQDPRNGSTRAFAAYFAARLGQREWAEAEIAQALHSSPGDNRVVRHAVLTYEALGLRDKALASLTTASPELLRELDQDPDLADLRQDSRFRQLVDKSVTGGN